MKSFALGLIVGLLLAAPLVSILFLLHATMGTPFIPFDLFDGLVRILPGTVITFGIDTMVRLLMFLRLNLSDSSKIAEQIQATAIFLSISALGAGIFFAVLKSRDSRSIVPLGVVLGISIAIPMTIGAGSPVWTMAALTAWGVAVSAVRYRVAGLGPDLTASAAPELAAPASSLEPVDRRRFLINLGGTTASITVVGAVVAAALRTSSEPVVHATSEVPLPDRSGDVEPAPGTRPEYTPVADHYRIDIDLWPMKIEEDTWRLPITGMVEHPLNLTLGDFRNFDEQQHLFVTLACISNPLGGDLIGTTRWSGVSVRRVLRDAGVHDRAQFLKLTWLSQSSIDFWFFRGLTRCKSSHCNTRLAVKLAVKTYPLSHHDGFLALCHRNVSARHKAQERRESSPLLQRCGEPAASNGWHGTTNGGVSGRDQ